MRVLTPTTRAARRGSRRPARDQGSAMIVTLMVMAVVSALAGTVASVTVNNLGASVKAQQAGSALNAADAGIAQAVAYLRSAGVGGLACSPSCATNPWGNQNDPATATVAGVAGQAYSAWIEPLAPYPANSPGRYRIHSTGTAKGSAKRVVESDVQVARFELPLGIFARTVNGGGDVDIRDESVFSTGCVYERSKLEIVGTDAVYGIPAGVHTSQIVTDSQGSGQFCPTTNKPIHTIVKPCNTDYPYDQDRFGGTLVASSCAGTQTTYQTYYGTADHDGDGIPDVNGSYVRDEATLARLYGVRQPALSQYQLASLRAMAQTQGNLWTSATGWTSPDERQAVMYFDLTNTDPGGLVDLNDIVGFGRATGLAANDPACDDRSLVVVIEGGNARLNANQKLTASVFLVSGAPYGQLFKANGTSTYIGTIYGDTVHFTGTADISMDACFAANLSPGLLQVDQTAYRELDR